MSDEIGKTPDELAGSDLGVAPSAWIANNQLQSITIVGRSPAARAKFDPVMIQELGDPEVLRWEQVGLVRSTGVLKPWASLAQPVCKHCLRHRLSERSQGEAHLGASKAARR